MATQLPSWPLASVALSRKRCFSNGETAASGVGVRCWDARYSTYQSLKISNRQEGFDDIANKGVCRCACISGSTRKHCSSVSAGGRQPPRKTDGMQMFPSQTRYTRFCGFPSSPTAAQSSRSNGDFAWQGVRTTFASMAAAGALEVMSWRFGCLHTPV